MNASELADRLEYWSEFWIPIDDKQAKAIGLDEEE